MQLDTIFPSKYVKASDLKGKQPTVAIAEAKIEAVGQDSKKLVLYFQGTEKGLVCNRTNADRIAHLYGNDTDDWVGKEITLYSEMVNFQGKVVDAIRVKAPIKHSKQPVVEVVPDDEDDFHSDGIPF